MSKTAKTKQKLAQPEAAAAPPDIATQDFSLHEAIEVRAYEIYKERGEGEGQALDDWLQAEREILELSRRTSHGEL